MKTIFKSALVAVAAFAVAFTSCDKPVITPNGDTQTVALSLKKQSTTRASLNGTVAGGTFTDLENGTIYFFDTAGDIVSSYSLDAANIPGPTTGTTKDYVIINGISSAAVSAAMIANYPGGVAPSVASFTDFKTKSVSLASQSGTVGASGAAAVDGISLIDQAGNTTTANALADFTYNAGTDPAAWAAATKQVTITLVPAVARFEIATNSLKTAANNTTGLVQFGLKGMYLNNYYNTLSMSKTVSDITYLAGDATTNKGAAWIANYTAITPNTPVVNIQYDEPTNAVVDGTGYTGGFAYHAFGGSQAPQIVIAAENVKLGGSTLAGPLFWVIDEYKDATSGNAVTIEMGKVYKITNVEFGATLPGAFPGEQGTTVKATVQVMAWDAVNVNVNPK